MPLFFLCAGPTASPTQSSTEPPSVPSTEATSVPTPTQPPLPTKVVDVRVTPSVMNMSPTLTVTWQALASEAVTYTVKYSTQPGELNTPPEGALEKTGISGTSTILTALKRGTTYYIWVVGVSEEGEGLYSDRLRGVTYDSELGSINIVKVTCSFILSVHAFYIVPTSLKLKFYRLPSN